MPLTFTRRRLLTALSAAGAVGITGAPQVLAAAEELETTSLRLVNDGSICIAPEYIAKELLRAEGFTDIRYVETAATQQVDAVVRSEIDFCNFAVGDIRKIDAGVPIVVLAGIHVGCFELFAREGIRHIAELKGKSIGLRGGLGLLTLMAAEVGLDPAKDIRWVIGGDRGIDPFELFVQGKIDAFMGFPPEPQELRARHAGHAILNTTTDRPWSQYFCCMLASSRDYVRQHPVATKRVLRAILKAADLCASEPARAAQRLVEDGFTPRYDYAHETLSGIPYDKWRDYDAEDSIRFYALRMHEAGLIKSSPQKIIAEGTDWRFLNELKRELKA